MDASVLLTSFGVIFLAELGDKTQLAAMMLATRYPWRRAFLGIASAFFLLNLAAVAAGAALFRLAPLPWLQAAAALIFIAFGLLAFRFSNEDDGPDAATPDRGPFLTSFGLILLAELGDKTQLMTASLAAQSTAPWSVFLGSTFALWVVALMGLLIGARLSRWIPARVIRAAGGALFIAIGAAVGYQALR